MYTKSGESIDILLYCEEARDLWNSPFNLFGVEWDMPRKVKELLVNWGGQVGHGDTLEVWRLALLYLMCIWRKWKAQSFEASTS
jgi:hypothetical protein